MRKTNKPSVMITGAGRGLGRSIANVFHRNGYFVVATDYSTDLLADLEGSDGYLTAGLDVSDSTAAAQVAQLIKSEVGRLDVIVNNAGVNSFYPVVEAPPEKTISAFMVNTFGALITTQACLDLLIENNGRVINISSESSPFRTPFQYYQATKMALEALSDIMRRELMLVDVHVAFVRPGAIQTELLEGIHNINASLGDSHFSTFFSRFIEGVAKRAPKKRSTPSEVAAVVYKAATDDKKKVMYTINHNFFVKIMGKLPHKLVDKLLLKDLSP